jgi:hypothetical protein
VDNYEANIRAVRMPGQAYNFKVYCFWRPSLAFGRKSLVPFEQQLWNMGPDSSVATPFRILRAVNEEVARRSPQNSGFVADAMTKWIKGHPEN